MNEPEAESHWLDQHRDPTEAAVVWSLAAQVVAQHGGDLRGMRRALGISNATWVGGGLAVRIANTSVVDGMAAEVALVRALPPEVELRREMYSLDRLIADGSDPDDLEELRRRRREAELRFSLLVERRRGAA